MPIQPQLLLIIGLGLLSIGMLTFGLLRAGQQARLDRRLAALVPPLAGHAGASGSPSAILGRFESLLFLGAADRDEVTAKLRAAGFYGNTAPTIFGLLRLAAAIVVALACLLLLVYRDKLAGPARIYPVIAFAVGFLGAKFVLGWRVSVLQRELRKELPFALDLLLLMLESGVGLDQCLRQMAQVETGALRRMRPINAQLVDDLQNGMSYEVALERWADRLAIPGVRELASLFRQSLLYGTELGPALHVFVAEFSDKRISAARESIGKKTTQMTIVMIVFLMPALFIILAGPAFVSVSNAFK